jgi:MFS family permease
MSKSSKNTSTFAALRNPVFRKLWFASVLSGTCVAAHDCAATWVMYKLSASAFFLSLMSTVASLPFFLFTLPAGALADIVDRRKLLWIMNVWLAVAAGLLAIFGSLGVLNPYIILICIFLIGIGFAFTAPAWTAIVPEVVSNEELPSAATLGGLQLNISGILGPAIGGMLLPLIGANWVFTVNAICFLIVILAILEWNRKERPSKLPLENFFESFSTAIRYVRYAPGIQVVLARNILFAFFIALIPALIPVVGLKELKTHSGGLWDSVQLYGCGFRIWSDFCSTLVSGMSFLQYAHRNRESGDSGRLHPDGICPRPDHFHDRCCHCRNRADVVCVGTLGCSAARDAKLVERPHERDRHHGFPRGDGSGRPRLGSGRNRLGIVSYLDRRRSPVVDQFGSGDSSVD